MKAVVVVVVAAAACSPPTIPVPGHTAELSCLSVGTCEEWDPVVVADVLEDFVLRWRTLFGVNPLEPDVVAVVDVAEGEARVAYRAGTVFADVDGGPVDWPVLHGLVHAGLDGAGDDDPDHAAGDGPWTEDHDRLIVSAWRAGE